MPFRPVSCFLLLLLLLVSSGCASILHGTSDQIVVKTKTKGSKIYLGKKLVGTNEAVIKIPKSEERPIIFVKKKGCKDRIQVLKKEFDPASLAGMFIDLGVISIIAVDYSITGAISRIKPTEYNLDPICG